MYLTLFFSFFKIKNKNNILVIITRGIDIPKPNIII